MSTQPAWRAAHQLLRAAMKAPFVHWPVTRLVFVVFVLPALSCLLFLAAITSGLFVGSTRTVFFAPDGADDPVFAQTAYWLASSPAIPLILMALLCPILIWAQAVWLQGHGGIVSLRVGWGQIGRIFGAYATVLVAAVAILLVSLIFPMLVLLLLPVAVFVMFRFAPAMYASSGGPNAPWRFGGLQTKVVWWCVGEFTIFAIILGLPANGLELLQRVELMSPGAMLPWSFEIHSFLIFLTASLAWIYGLFVLTAMIAGLARKASKAQSALFR